MNKSTLSYQDHDGYSALLSPLPIKKKRKFKKEMFSKRQHEEEEEPQYQALNAEDVLPYFNIDPEVSKDPKEVQKLIKIHKMHRSSFEIIDKEKQCLQLSEKGNLWIVLSLLSGVCYAFNNFFLGQLSHEGLIAVMYVNIPSFLIFLTIYAINCIRNKLMHGFFWRKEISIFFKEEDDSFDWFVLFGVCMLSLFKFIGFCFVVQTFNYAIQAGINLGIITVIFNFCCITDSIVFYFFFNEKLSKGQVIGSSILLLAAYFISQKDKRPPGGAFVDESEQEKNTYYAIIYGLCTILFFSCRDFTLRYFRVYKNYSAFELSLDSLTIYALACTVASAYLFTIGGYEFHYNNVTLGCMSAVLNTLGFMMLAISVVIGYAGPANALNSIQAVVLTLLSVSLLQQIPSRMETIGMLMGIFGTIFVTTGDYILKNIQACEETKTPKEKFSLQNEKVINYFSQSFAKSRTNLQDFEQNECTRLLMNLTNYFLTYNATIQKIYRNSGKDYNDLGRYDDCLNLQDFHYILASIPKALPIPMNLGMCIPSVCQVGDFMGFKPWLVEALNSVMIDLFDDVKGFDPETQLTLDDLHFDQSYVLNKETTKAGGGAIFIILIILFFTITTIVSTVIIWHRRKLKQKKREARQSRRAQRLKNSENSTNNSESLGESKVSRRRRQEGMVLKNNLDGEESPVLEANQSPRRVSSRSKGKSCGQKFMNFFSLPRNTRALFKRRSTEEDSELETFNGVRVLCLCVIILGNTFFYILKGPLQNLEIIETWMSSSLFTVVISADLQADVFFWMGAFLSSYYMLCTMQENEGYLGRVPIIYLNKFMKLIPLYMFTLFFYWCFLAIFGGDGPIFFMYERQIQCSKYWWTHLLFLNNLIPWSSIDNCMHWTWFLANYFQFFLLVPLFVQMYYNKRKFFWISIGALFFLSFIISMIVILVNDLSASYFTYRDEYWSIYYVKPYARIPAYLIGVIAGCSYYTFKKDSEDSTIVAQAYEQVQNRNLIAALWVILGIVLQSMMIFLLQIINNSPNHISQGINCIYLLFQRPFFIIGFTMAFMPVVLQNQIALPFTNFLSHEFFVPTSRLTYGAFLSMGIFMQFRIYNVETGYWGCAFDAFLFFLAFLAFSYLFSFFTFIFIEQPTNQIYKGITASLQSALLKKPFSQNYVKEKKKLGSKRRKQLEENDLSSDLISTRTGSKKSKLRIRGEEIEAEDLEQESNSIFEEERKSLQYKDNDNGIGHVGIN